MAKLEQSPYLRVNEAAALLRCSRTTLYRLVRAKRLPPPLTLSVGVKLHKRSDVLALIGQERA